VGQVKQDQRLPFGAEHGKGGIQAAGERDRRHFQTFL
jgi:hypothetical protein